MVRGANTGVHIIYTDAYTCTHTMIGYTKILFKKKALMLKDKEGIGSREQGEKLALFE